MYFKYVLYIYWSILCIFTFGSGAASFSCCVEGEAPHTSATLCWNRLIVD